MSFLFQRLFGAAVAIAAMGTSFAASAEKIPYASRVGEDLTIREAAGLDSAEASIFAVHDKADAKIYCRDYLQDRSASCVRKTMATDPKSFQFKANCETGVFTTVGGRYRFVGPAKTDETSSAAFQVIDLQSGEDLDGSSASGYPVAMTVFRKLCPSRAEGEDFKQ
jgi:hypothetical protein